MALGFGGAGAGAGANGNGASAGGSFPLLGGALGPVTKMVRFEPGTRFPVHVHERPEFIFVLEGELVQAGRRLGPGWAGIASAGSNDDDVYSESGCVFVLVDRA